MEHSKKIVIIGSLCYIRNKFVSDLENIGESEKFDYQDIGGIAITIAHNIRLYNRKIPIEIVGSDGGEILDKLHSMNVGTQYVVKSSSSKTAYGIVYTDTKGNQKWDFRDTITPELVGLDLSSIALKEKNVLFVNTPMLREPFLYFQQHLIKLGADYMYDPGMSLSFIDDENLRSGVIGSKFLISNKEEIQQIINRLHIDKQFILDHDVRIIQTLGSDGVSYTRNAGLNIANGDYVMFLDSDDTCSQFICEKMYEEISSKKLDLVVCKANVVLDEELNVGNRDLYSSRNFATNSSHMIWNKIFKRELIEKYNIRFPESIRGGEDVFFTICYNNISNNGIGLLDEKLYNYLIRNGSLMSATKEKDNEKMFDCFKVCELLYNFFKRNNMLEKVYPIYFGNIRFATTQFTEKNYDRLAKVIFDCTKSKP
ncbi:MAG TPA: glycosyltransferase [Rickettsiales bacterium]|nr:glycosyltransferase [Rickettsiales bacterium]